MHIYLPIAELSANLFLLLGMGASVGFLSGLFGIGGGFLLTPLMIFMGINPAVAIASVSAQIVASSSSGALTHWKRGGVDIKLAILLILSGGTGSLLGVWVFGSLRETGQLDFIISASYVFFLGSVGILMLVEATRSILRSRKQQDINYTSLEQKAWLKKMPMKLHFPRSDLVISIIPVLGLGGTIGFIGAVLGIGGGFILIPALIYLLGIPTSVVIGTSLVHIVATLSIATILHAISTQSVDIVLALCLMVGGVFGAQMGASAGLQLKADHLRGLLGVLILAVGLRIAFGLVMTPDEFFSLSLIGGAR